MVSVARIPLLALRGVSTRFGNVQALSAVDLEINEGEVVALVGDNGAGKSTLVKAIAGVSPPDSGVIDACAAELCRLRSSQGYQAGSGGCNAYIEERPSVARLFCLS